MNYKENFMVQDFAERTIANLNYVRSNARGDNLYEVTQLINSLLGLIVFPKESSLSRIPSTKYKNLAKKGWPESVLVETNSENNLNKLVRRLRNAIAHCNIGFVVGRKNALVGVQFWSGENREDSNWKVQLSLDDLQVVVSKLIEVWKKNLKETNFEIIKALE